MVCAVDKVTQGDILLQKSKALPPSSERILRGHKRKAAQMELTTQTPPSGASTEVRELIEMNKHLKRLDDSKVKDKEASNFADTVDWEDLMLSEFEVTPEMKWFNQVEYAFHSWILENTDGCCSEVCLGTLDGVEPTTLQEALERPDGHKYSEATNSEMNGDYENNTFTPCELPVGFTPISTRLVYTC